MAQIRCHYVDCVFLEEGYCSSVSIELDPIDGCLTYTQAEISEEPEWEGEPLVGQLWDDDEEDEDLALYEEDDDLEDDWDDEADF